MPNNPTETNTVHVVGLGPVEIPAGLDPAELHRSLNEFIQAQPSQAPSLGIRTTQPTATGAIENSPAFRMASQAAWNAIGQGLAKKEAGFAVHKNGFTDSLQQAYNSGGGEIDMRIPSDAMSVVHTHPNMLQDNPSKGDIASARKAGIPIYIVSRSGLWMADPNGNVTHVYSDPNWMNKN
jgi:hypothetical protein